MSGSRGPSLSWCSTYVEPGATGFAAPQFRGPQLVWSQLGGGISRALVGGAVVPLRSCQALFVPPLIAQIT